MGQSGAPPFHELVPNESFSMAFHCFSSQESSGLKFMAFVLCIIPIIVGVGHIEKSIQCLRVHQSMKKSFISWLDSMKGAQFSDFFIFCLPCLAWAFVFF